LPTSLSCSLQVHASHLGHADSGWMRSGRGSPWCRSGADKNLTQWHVGAVLAAPAI